MVAVDNKHTLYVYSSRSCEYEAFQRTINISAAVLLCLFALPRLKFRPGDGTASSSSFSHNDTVSSSCSSSWLVIPHQVLPLAASPALQQCLVSPPVSHCSIGCCYLLSQLCLRIQLCVVGTGVGGCGWSCPAAVCSLQPALAGHQLPAGS